MEVLPVLAGFFNVFPLRRFGVSNEEEDKRFIFFPAVDPVAWGYSQSLVLEEINCFQILKGLNPFLAGTPQTYLGMRTLIWLDFRSNPKFRWSPVRPGRLIPIIRPFTSRISKDRVSDPASPTGLPMLTQAPPWLCVANKASCIP